MNQENKRVVDFNEMKEKRDEEELQLNIEEEREIQELIEEYEKYANNSDYE